MDWADEKAAKAINPEGYTIHWIPGVYEATRRDVAQALRDAYDKGFQVREDIVIHGFEKAAQMHGAYLKESE